MSINKILDESYLLLRNVNMASYDGNQSLYVGMDLNNTKKQVSEESSTCDAAIFTAKTCADKVMKYQSDFPPCEVPIIGTACHAAMKKACNACEVAFKETKCSGKVQWVNGKACKYVESKPPTPCGKCLPSGAKNCNQACPSGSGWCEYQDSNQPGKCCHCDPKPTPNPTPSPTSLPIPKYCPPNCYTTSSPAGPKKTIDKTKCSGWVSEGFYSCCMTKTTDGKAWKCSGTKPDLSKEPYCPKNDKRIMCNG